jgi:hypothetical protein
MSNSPSAIQTFSGVFIDPFAPDPTCIRIEDLAHAVANQCRFSGHTRRHWSVAAHSCLVSLLCSDEHKLDGLMHDAHEAICVDVPSPLKQHPSMQGYRDLEATIEAAVRLRFRLAPKKSHEVVLADNIALWAEAGELLHGTSGWSCNSDKAFYERRTFWARERIREMIDLDSEKLFLENYFLLTGGDIHASL